MFVGYNDSITRFLSRPSHTKRNRGCKKQSHPTFADSLRFQFSVFNSQFSVPFSPARNGRKNQNIGDVARHP